MIFPVFSKLPMRQLTRPDLSRTPPMISKLPMRQLTLRRDGSLYRYVSKLPMRQLTTPLPYPDLLQNF